MQHFAGRNDGRCITTDFKQIAAIANLNRQALFNLTQVLVKLAAEAGKGLGAVWRCVHERLTQSLEAITLEDLCKEVQQASGEPIDHRYVFHI